MFITKKHAAYRESHLIFTLSRNSAVSEIEDVQYMPLLTHMTTFRYARENACVYVTVNLYNQVICILPEFFK